MYLFCYETRPQIIKMFPLIKCFKRHGIEFKTYFTNQHADMFADFKYMIPEPDFVGDEFDTHRSLNTLTSKIIQQTDKILKSTTISYVIIQGDTTSAMAVALAAFNSRKKIIHLEAGLRTYNRLSPYPEEVNRCLISKLADIHLCPTSLAVENLKREGITQNVYHVGNTVADAFQIIKTSSLTPTAIKDIIQQGEYFVVTLHRRENRLKIKTMWSQLNKLSQSYKFVYILHPSLMEAVTYLSSRIMILKHLDYVSMIHLISGSKGIITDSGGIQEESICCGKKVLICRDTTERPECVDSGWGKLVGSDITSNMMFLTHMGNTKSSNPYGNNVSKKIVEIIKTSKYN